MPAQFCIRPDSSTGNKSATACPTPIEPERLTATQFSHLRRYPLPCVLYNVTSRQVQAFKQGGCRSRLVMRLKVHFANEPLQVGNSDIHGVTSWINLGDVPSFYLPVFCQDDPWHGHVNIVRYERCLIGKTRPEVICSIFTCRLRHRRRSPCHLESSGRSGDTDHPSIASGG